MIAGEVVGTITDELIIRLIGGDDDAHVRVIDHREKLASIAKWRGTVNGDVLGAILAFDSKFRKLPKTLDALDEFGIRYGRCAKLWTRDQWPDSRLP